MSEEKLTVAELLARRQKEGATSDVPRRRRRRSLEEGGVSVQELTGSIPRVQAGEPRRGAHALSSTEDDRITTDDLLADDVAVDDTEEAQVTESGADAPDQPETVAEAEVDADDVDSSEHEVQGEADDEAAGEAEAEAAREEVAESEATDSADLDDDADSEDSDSQDSEEEDSKAPVESQQSQAVEVVPTPQPPASVVPLVIPMDPRPVMVNSERAEITYTFTELRDLGDDSRTIGQPGPVARAVLTGSNAYDDRPTATIPVVPDNADHLDDAVDDSDNVGIEQPVETAAEDVDVDQGLDTTDSTAASDATDTVEAVDTADAYEAEAATAAAPEIVQDEDEVAPAEATADVEEPESRDVVKRAAVNDKAVESEDYAEDNSLSVPLLLIQVFVGLIAGALVFLGFTMAWSALPTIVAVIMALVVTCGLAGMANYVRRKKDVLTPILAGLVGLVLTFGPWVIFQL